MFRETPKLKTGRWASYRAKTCKGIPVRASGWELGTPDRSLGYSELAWNLEEFPEIQERGQLKIRPGPWAERLLVGAGTDLAYTQLGFISP